MAESGKAWGVKVISGDPRAVGQAVGTAATIAYAAEDFDPRLYNRPNGAGGGGITLENTPGRGDFIRFDMHRLHFNGRPRYVPHIDARIGAIVIKHFPWGPLQ